MSTAVHPVATPLEVLLPLRWLSDASSSQCQDEVCKEFGEDIDRRLRIIHIFILILKQIIIKYVIQPFSVDIFT